MTHRNTSPLSSTTDSFSLLSLSESTTSAKMGKTVKVAAVQAEPVRNDLQGGVEKAIAIIEEAGSNGTNVLGFPEVFIPGYPW